MLRNRRPSVFLSDAEAGTERGVRSLGRRAPSCRPIHQVSCAVPWAARALRRAARPGLAQGAGSRRVDALLSVIRANPLARRGLLTHDLFNSPRALGGLGRLGLDDAAVSRLQDNCSHPLPLSIVSSESRLRVAEAGYLPRRSQPKTAERERQR